MSGLWRESLTVQLIRDIREQVKAQADALRREEYRMLLDFYEGGRAPLSDEYVRRHYREEDEAWLARRQNLRGLNITRAVPERIRDALYGRTVLKGVRTRQADAQPSRQEAQLAIPSKYRPTGKGLQLADFKAFTRPLEGYRERAYRDSEGKMTVGIGFNMERAGARKTWAKRLPEVSFDEVFAKKTTLNPDQINRL